MYTGDSEDYGTRVHVFAKLQLSQIKDSCSRARISLSSVSIVTVSAPYKLYYSDKNRKNPFVLVETTSFTLCLHPSACERAHSVSLQPPRQSLWDFAQAKRKTPRCRAKKQRLVHPVITVRSCVILVFLIESLDVLTRTWGDSGMKLVEVYFQPD